MRDFVIQPRRRSSRIQPTTLAPASTAASFITPFTETQAKSPYLVSESSVNSASIPSPGAPASTMCRVQRSRSRTGSDGSAAGTRSTSAASVARDAAVCADASSRTISSPSGDSFMRSVRPCNAMPLAIRARRLSSLPPVARTVTLSTCDVITAPTESTASTFERSTTIVRVLTRTVESPAGMLIVPRSSTSCSTRRRITSPGKGRSMSMTRASAPPSIWRARCADNVMPVAAISITVRHMSETVRIIANRKCER